jgi:hypothetical protein
MRELQRRARAEQSLPSFEPRLADRREAEEDWSR